MALTKTSYSMIVGAPINVADYSALGDGTTDASTAINAALNACPEYGTVVFPSGTYVINATITIPKNNITLDGQGSRFIAKAATNFEYVLFADSKSNISVRNLTIDANQANRISGQNIRFMGGGFTSCEDSYFENCIAKNALGYASIPAVGLTFGGVCIRCEFINCIAQNCGTVTQGADGFFASGEANMMIGCNAVNCTDTGFAIESSNASGIVGCIARSCAAAAAITNAVNDDKYGNFITDLSGFDITGGGGVTGLIQIGCPLSTSTGVLYDTLISNVNLVSVGASTGVGPAINIRKTGTPKAVRVTLNNVNIKNATAQGILVDANQVSIRGCDITGTTNACINFLTASASNFVSGCTFFGGSYGVLTSGTATATVENNLMNGQTAYGIFAESTSTINAMFNIIQTPSVGSAGKDGGATLNLVSGLSGLQVNNASGSAPIGALSNKIQVFDRENNSLGFIAVYNN
tara:strand:+ start:954 stop:2351 length:1398 start_codon:yes stop_codon:yes gene_type:complete